MNSVFLKEFTYEYILLHDDLTTDEKMAVASFVKEASDEQVMALLLSGECRSELEEGEGEFVRELFSYTAIPLAESYLQEVLLEIGAENPFTAADAGTMGKAAAKGVVAGAKGAVKGGKAAYQQVKQGGEALKKLALKMKSVKISTDVGATPESPFGTQLAKAPVKGQSDVAGLAKAQAQMSKSFASYYKTAMDAIQSNRAASAIVVAALISLVAVKVYRAYLSKAAKACKGQADKAACMKKFKQSAIQAKIKELSSGINACSAAKNPAKCKASIQKKIAKEKIKLSKK